jgi:hypothetical protein
MGSQRDEAMLSAGRVGTLVEFCAKKKGKKKPAISRRSNYDAIYHAAGCSAVIPASIFCNSPDW